MKTVYELFHKAHPDEAATDRRGTHGTLDEAKATVGQELSWEGVGESWAATASARSHWLIIEEKVGETDAERIELALDVAYNYSQVDGAHHKAYAIDQMVRALLGDRYEAWITEYRAGEDGPESYDWDEGIAP